jgi:hypothetical protein
VKKISKARGIKPREYRAIQDCIENMDDSLDSLSQSVRELGSIMGSFLKIIKKVNLRVNNNRFQKKTFVR